MRKNFELWVEISDLPFLVFLAGTGFHSVTVKQTAPPHITPFSFNGFHVKGIVHPKMKILSSFTHPQVVPNLYECVYSAEHKGRYSEECGKRSSSGAPLTSIVFFSYYGSQWCPKTAWLQTFFKISSFVFSRTKTFIQVWNYLRMSKWWQNVHFWVNYPFKCFRIRRTEGTALLCRNASVYFTS